jgi:AraC family transcriptional regulator, transcriptional activator of pobA
MQEEIKRYRLDHNYIFIHKEAVDGQSNFGLDNSMELIEHGFGIYSSSRVRSKIGPLKSEFFRLSICRGGNVQVDCGLESFTHQRDTIHFNFPGQIFSLYNKSEDMSAYYILFSEEFMEDFLPMATLQNRFAFLDYAGTPFFQLSAEEAEGIEQLFHAIDAEIKRGGHGLKQAIQSYLHLILIAAQRSYLRQDLGTEHHEKQNSLVLRYKKLVGKHFLRQRSVSAYASQLAVTPSHLNKLLTAQTGKTAGDFIDDMLVMEAKALLRHSALSISEIAYQLAFTDPSHFNKFFKRMAQITPSHYRNAG